MSNKRTIFFLACAGILFFGIGITTLGSIVSHLKVGFSLSEIEVGTLFSILPFGILVGSLLFGPIADRFGFRVLLAFTCWSMAAGFIGIALTSFHAILKVAVFLFGLGGGAINGGTSALVADISEENKGANLSILGVFFGVGALGLPFILGLLEGRVSYQTIILSVGILSFVMGIAFLLAQFPQAKQAAGISLKEIGGLFKNPFLLLVAFFLFFQSAFEGIINNWTPTYLMEFLDIPSSNALYALSLSVVGMVVMRLLLGSLLRGTSVLVIWKMTFSLLFLGVLFLLFFETYYPVLVGVVLIGAGLAAGFPIMLGTLGENIKQLSGTAFSIAFSISLVGNMLVNYLIGVVAQHYGIGYLRFFSLGVFLLMAALCLLIMRNLRTSNQD